MEIASPVEFLLIFTWLVKQTLQKQKNAGNLRSSLEDHKPNKALKHSVEINRELNIPTVVEEINSYFLKSNMRPGMK